MMMIVRQTSVLLLLLATAVTIGRSEDVSFACPESCTCTDITVDHRDLKHARCESVEALTDKQWPVFSLDLSGLGLTKVPAAVEKLRNLTRLDLSHNHISEVARIGNRVQELNLSHNRIGSGKLAKLPQFLRKLNLAHNHISHVPVSLKKMDLLQELELSGNPINCSCDTIQVRNWLQSRNVWTKDAIKCHSPLNYKGRSWLQVKQSDVCHMTPAEIEEEKNIWEDTNDLMMGDQAAAGSGEGHDDDMEDLDGVEDDYMPVDDPRSLPHGEADAELEEGSGAAPIDIHAPKVLVEGSGDDEDHHHKHPIGHDEITHDVTTGNPVTGDDEEDGSGDEILPLVPIIPQSDTMGRTENKKDKDFPTEDEDHKPDGDSPITPPDDNTTPKSIKDLGIFEPSEKKPDNSPVEEVAVTAAPKVLLDSPNKQGPPVLTEQPQKADSSDKLYILLGIILIIMVALIIIVVCKQKSNRRRNNRRGQNDVESAKNRELQDMNKQLIGKPMEKNGTGENAPLMGQRDRSDYARPINGQKDSDMIGFNPYDKTEPETQLPLKNHAVAAEEEPIQQQQPPAMDTFKPVDRAVSKDSINENGANPDEDVNNNSHFQPITNGYPQTNGVAHSPPDSPAGVHKSKRDEDWEKYTPRSPDMKRYSPVYSPETGRVKIRLSETPKPKTPLLVTRSRSNAGQMILTPNLSQRTPRTAAEDEPVEA